MTTKINRKRWGTWDFDTLEALEALNEQGLPPVPKKVTCPYCGGTDLSPYADGGSCPHCIRGEVYEGEGDSL